MPYDPYASSSIPGTRDRGRRARLPGTADRNSFWNRNQIAPYNPPGVADDRITSLKRGGRIKRTGIYKLHAGERVIPRSRRRGRR